MAKFTTTTAAGKTVEIEPHGYAYCGSPIAEVRVYAEHPQHGPTLVVGRHHVKGNLSGHAFLGFSGEPGTPSFRGGKYLASAGASISRTDFDRAMAEAQAQAEAAVAAEREAERRRESEATAACPGGYVSCRQKWSNGDLMAACYVAEDGTEVIASDLLESHGGWYWLPAEKVEAARAEATAKAEAAARRDRERAEATSSAIDRAKSEGRRVEVGRWTEPCDDPAEECSLDVCVRYAEPDGTLRVERSHTW